MHYIWNMSLPTEPIKEWVTIRDERNPWLLYEWFHLFNKTTDSDSCESCQQFVRQKKERNVSHSFRRANICLLSPLYDHIKSVWVSFAADNISSIILDFLIIPHTLYRPDEQLTID